MRQFPIPAPGTEAPVSNTATDDTRPYLLERVGDAAVVQYYADGFDSLDLERKRLVWHLYEAALSGRDIYYDQRYAHSLAMRVTLEQILRHRDAIDPAAAAAIEQYTKLFWLNSGPHNTLTARKFVPSCTREAFAEAARAARAAGARFPLAPGETLDAFLARMLPRFFDPDLDPIVTNKSPEGDGDILLTSANNLYDGVSMGDLEGFDERCPLNSRLVKRDGKLVEEVYRVGGRYSAAIERIVAHLRAAMPHAPASTRAALEALVRFYETGETSDRVAYDIAWVADTDAPVDTINGFIEVYMDPRGCKGSWESLVCIVHPEKTAGMARLAAAAQWFEDRMPWAPEWRKPHVRGVTARAIEAVVECGDSGPITPIGINLPNDEAIREKYGSKSVTLTNITHAYDKSLPPGFREEFSWTPEEAARAERWGSAASELATALHEVIGHGSGRIAERLNGNPQAALREHFSALEETRADLVALYWIADPKMVELGLVEAAHHEELVLAEYEGYCRNALTQLRRIRTGNTIEEDHMRNRQAIVHWLIDNTTSVEVRRRDGRTFYVLVDVAGFREGVGRLLAEVQRIKAEGDFEAAAALFERYGIRFDPALRDEVVRRVEPLGMPSYTGFVQPRLEPVYAPDGTIADVRISYPCDLMAQMFEYAERYSTLVPELS